MSEKFACVDIGSHRVKVLLAERIGPQKFGLLGVGSHLTGGGVEAGVVIDIETTSQAVANAFAKAHREVGKKFTYECIVSITGDHLKCIKTNSLHTVVKSRQVSQKDIDTLVDLAMAEPVDREQEILDVIPRQYILDGSHGVVRPLNMSCQHLGLEAIMVLAHPNKKLNLLNTVTNNNLTVRETVASGLASAQAVASKNELDADCCVIDIGAGTVDVSVFKKNVLESMFVLNTGGSRVTEDISRVFRITQENAEDLKIEYGHAVEVLIEEKENIDIDIRAIGHDTAKQISRKSLATAIGPCYEDMLKQIRTGISATVAYPQDITYILTGGGSQIEGLRFLAEEIFDAAVRIGNPIFPGERGFQVEASPYASCIGLLKRQVSNAKRANIFGVSNSAKHPQGKENRFLAWFKANF